MTVTPRRSAELTPRWEGVCTLGVMGMAGREVGVSSGEICVPGGRVCLAEAADLVAMESRTVPVCPPPQALNRKINTSHRLTGRNRG